MKIENNKTEAPKGSKKSINIESSFSAGVPLIFSSPICAMEVVVNLFE